MFTIQVKDKRTGNFTEEVLAQITEKSTGYEYGQAVADSITEPVKNHTSAEVSVFHDGELIHRLLIVPKGGAVMVTENGAGTKPLSFRFAVNTSLWLIRSITTISFTGWQTLVAASGALSMAGSEKAREKVYIHSMSKSLTNTRTICTELSF